MRHAQLLAWGLEGPLLDSLRALAQDRAVWLREVRQPKACLALLLEGGAGAFVLRLGRNIDEELSLLESVSRLFPEIPTIVVGDTPHPGLAALAWDLGAKYVLMPPQPIEELPEIVKGFLT
jgi:hypothetical protein